MPRLTTAPRVLVIDNYDSFVYTIVGYLEQLGTECKVVRNDAVEASAASTHDGVLVSPGPGTPEDAGISMPEASEPCGVIYFTRHYRLNPGCEEPPRGKIPATGDLVTRWIEARLAGEAPTDSCATAAP